MKGEPSNKSNDKSISEAEMSRLLVCYDAGIRYDMLMRRFNVSRKFLQRTIKERRGHGQPVHPQGKTPVRSQDEI